MNLSNLGPSAACEGRGAGRRGLRLQIERWAASDGAQAWLRRVVIVYVVAVFAIRIHHAGDFAGYLAVGELVLRGENPYRGAGALNTWPPFFNVLCAPLALLARPTPYLARGVWFVLNFLCLWWILSSASRLVYGQRLVWTGDRQGMTLTSPWMFLPFLATERYVSSNFDHVQINLILFALVLAGLRAQHRGFWGRGAVQIGAAAAIKVMPITFIGYLAWRRRWRSAIATAVATAAFSLSPALVFGWERYWEYVAAWRERISAGWGVGRLNQSVWAMWDRWLGHGMVPILTPGAHDIPASGSPWVLPAVAATAGMIVGVAWWRWRKGTPSTWQCVAEWSFVFTATALFSPVTWKAYLAVLLLPNVLFFAAWWVAAPGSREARIAAVGLWATAATNALSPGLIGKNLAGRVEMGCLPTMLGLTVLVMLAWLQPYLARLEAVARRRLASPDEQASSQ